MAPQPPHFEIPSFGPFPRINGPPWNSREASFYPFSPPLCCWAVPTAFPTPTWPAFPLFVRCYLLPPLCPILFVVRPSTFFRLIPTPVLFSLSFVRSVCICKPPFSLLIFFSIFCAVPNFHDLCSVCFTPWNLNAQLGPPFRISKFLLLLLCFCLGVLTFATSFPFLYPPCF